MNADERSDDGPRRRARPRFVPDEAWIDAFDRQCTKALLRDLQSYAAYLAQFVRGERATRATDYADELVQDALTDTMSGLLRWDPTTTELALHLTDVLRLRARRDSRRRPRYDHVSIDASATDDPSSALAEAEAALAVAAIDTERQEREDPARRMTRLIVQLRVLAAGDPLAQRFLDACEQRAETRAAVMQLGGLTASEYHNTRRRLTRLMAQLEPVRGAPAKEH